MLHKSSLLVDLIEIGDRLLVDRNINNLDYDTSDTISEKAWINVLTKSFSRVKNVLKMITLTRNGPAFMCDGGAFHNFVSNLPHSKYYKYVELKFYIDKITGLNIWEIVYPELKRNLIKDYERDYGNTNYESPELRYRQCVLQHFVSQWTFYIINSCSKFQMKQCLKRFNMFLENRIYTSTTTLKESIFYGNNDKNQSHKETSNGTIMVNDGQAQRKPMLYQKFDLNEYCLNHWNIKKSDRCTKRLIVIFDSDLIEVNNLRFEKDLIKMFPEVIFGSGNYHLIVDIMSPISVSLTGQFDGQIIQRLFNNNNTAYFGSYSFTNVDETMKYSIKSKFLSNPTTKNIDENGRTIYGFSQRTFSLSFKALPSILKIGNEFLNNCYGLTFIDFHTTSNIRSIGKGFMKNCPNLTSIHNLSVFRNIKHIPDQFLHMCSGIESINLSPMTSVETIGSFFLAECGSLKSIHLNSFSKHLKQIENCFLFNCIQLMQIKWKGDDDVICYTLEDTASNKYNGVSSNDHIDASHGDITPFVFRIESIGSSFMRGCVMLSSIELDMLCNVKSIGHHFLYNCPLIDLNTLDLSIFIPNLTSIGHIGLLEIPQCFDEGCSIQVNLDSDSSYSTTFERNEFGTWLKEIARVQELIGSHDR